MYSSSEAERHDHPRAASKRKSRSRSAPPECYPTPLPKGFAMDVILLAIACWVGVSITLSLLLGRAFKILGRSVSDPNPERVSAAGTRAAVRSSSASAARTRIPRMPAGSARVAQTN